MTHYGQRNEYFAPLLKTSDVIYNFTFAKVYLCFFHLSVEFLPHIDFQQVRASVPTYAAQRRWSPCFYSDNIVQKGNKLSVGVLCETPSYFAYTGVCNSILYKWYFTNTNYLSGIPFLYGPYKIIVIKIAIGWSFHNAAKSINLDNLKNAFAEKGARRSLWSF